MKKAFYYLIQFSLIQGLILGLISYPTLGAGLPKLNQIKFNNRTNTLKIDLTGKPIFKIVQIDKKEIMVALRSIILPREKFLKSMANDKYIDIAKHRDVVVLVLNTEKDIKKFIPKWDKHNRILSVKLIKSKGQRVVQKYIKKKSRPRKMSQAQIRQPKTIEQSSKRTIKKIKPLKDTVTKSSKVVGQKAPSVGKAAILVQTKSKNQMEGNTDDFIIIVKKDPCLSHGDLQAALEYGEKELWQDAVYFLSQFVNSGSQSSCLEVAYFMRAYFMYKMGDLIQEGKTTQLIDTLDYLQLAMSHFPESKYMPFALTTIGKIYNEMSNAVMASAYFNVVKKRFMNYTGRPEVLLELGKNIGKKKNWRAAADVFKTIIKKYPDSVMVADAQIELGKALYEAQNYSGSLKYLNAVMEKSPNKAYQNPDVLYSIGNSYYQYKKYDQARKFLNMAFNFFPEMDDNHIILTRIGDSYADQNNIDRALKIYELVIERFPETEGFIISSMRRAKYLNDRAEKEKIYNMILDNHTHNPMAKLALLRIASLQNKAQEYLESNKSIEELMVMSPGSLRNDALYLMKENYLSLFQKYQKTNEYPKVLTLYEKNKRSFSKFEDPKIFNIIGKSYIQAKLYDQAADALSQAYKRYEDKTRPPTMLFQLGTSLFEAKRYDKALKVHKSFVKQYKTDENVVAAYIQIGKIYTAKNDFKSALKNFNVALSSARNNIEKAQSLLGKADVYKSLEEHQKTIENLTTAVRLMVPTDHKYATQLFFAHRNLAEAYTKTNSYLKAADSFSKAIQFTKPGTDNADLQFMMAEAYQNGNKLEQAIKIYKGLVGSENEFWARLAEEKLQGINLDKKLKNT